jgi:branched-chain amino acid transport system permease protein
METFIQTFITGILTGGLYALIGIGLNMVFGVMRVVNFAHGALVMVGMYLTWLAFSFLGIDPFVSLFITLPVMFVFGIVLQRVFIAPLLKAPEFNQILLTEGLGIILVNVALLLFSGNYQLVNPSGPLYDDVLRLGGVVLDYKRLVAFFIALILTGALFWFLSRTDIGKSMRATAQDREAARLMGINVRRVSELAMGIGVAMAGAAGTLLTPIYQRVEPFIGAPFTLRAFVVIVLGGLGSITGATVGGILLGLVEAFAGAYNPTFLGGAGAAPIYGFLIFLAVLLFKPSGLFGGSRL